MANPKAARYIAKLGTRPTNSTVLRFIVWVIAIVPFSINWTQSGNMVWEVLFGVIIGVVVALAMAYQSRKEDKNQTAPKPKYQQKDFNYIAVAVVAIIIWLGDNVNGGVAGVTALFAGLLLIFVAYLIRPGGRLDPDRQKA